jgi:hypothetical protein
LIILKFKDNKRYSTIIFLKTFALFYFRTAKSDVKRPNQKPVSLADSGRSQEETKFLEFQTIGRRMSNI